MKEKNERKTRIRHYGQNYKGEIIVFIHASGEGLKTESIYKTLFKNFKYISQVTVVNKNKLKVLFQEKENRKEAIEEANTLAECEINGCFVYIPAKYVEVQGVVSWPISENIVDFVNGKGKFKNPQIQELKVLDSIRLKKKSSEASNEPILVDTSIVIITFEGNLLPDTLKLDKLLIPVREYRRREMFCVNCKKYGHTEKMCNNNKLLNPAFLCVQCKSNDHLGGSINCPRRKVLEKKQVMTMRKLRNRTFAEMLKELDPTGIVHETSENHTVPSTSFPTRKEQVAQKQSKKPVVQKPQAQKQTQSQKSPSTSNKYPPGFKRPSDIQPVQWDGFTKTVIEKIQNIMSDFNFSPLLQQLIITHSAPYIDRFVKCITNSFENQIKEMFGI